MAGITVVIFFLSTSIFCIDAGMYHDTQVHNVTRPEKRSPMISIQKPPLDCSKANYDDGNLYDFIYTHNCFPVGWDGFLNIQEVKDEIVSISGFLSLAVEEKTLKMTTVEGTTHTFQVPGDDIEPPMHDMFNAFKGLPLDGVKVIIMGQDPTPQAGKATGMAFSLKPGVKPGSVPSVLNILKELDNEGVSVDPANGDLTPWKNQGVLLLNAALTVQQGAGKAGTHQQRWAKFTELLVKYISTYGPQPCAWILWGSEAQKIQKFITAPVECILTGGHPSPLNKVVPFLGGNYFLDANQCLKNADRVGVDWSLP